MVHSRRAFLKEVEWARQTVHVGVKRVGCADDVLTQVHPAGPQVWQARSTSTP